MKHRYSDTLHNQRIALLGPLPPPLGGVSVHIERVIGKLKIQHNTVYHFNSTSEWRYRCFLLYTLFLVFFLIRKRPQVVVYHTSYLSNALKELQLLLFCKQFLRFQLYLIEHDCRFVYALSEKQKNDYQRILDNTTLQVFIGTQTAASFNENELLAKRQSMESAFLPPDVRDSNRLWQAYPATLSLFMQQHSPLIAANAFQLSLLNGRDLYGFDQLVTAFTRYAQHNTHAGLLLVLAQKGDAQLYKQLIARITTDQLCNRVYLLEGNYVLWPLLSKVDLFVRPTLSDGASISVEEALYCGVKVIASDVCWRPEACELYTSGDVDALYYTFVTQITQKH